MSGIAIILLIVIFFWIVWPIVSRWMRRKAVEKAEDYMRASMGMPPRDKKKNKTKYQNPFGSRTGQQSHTYGKSTPDNEPLIPKEYAEDVEFTEVKSFSEDSIEQDSKKHKVYHESQISDVEYIEIKKSRSK